jgi:kanosamine 6-kinase
MDGERVTVLGIDIGGTKVAVRAEAADRPAVQSAFSWPSPGDPRRDLEALAAHLDAWRDRWVAPPAAVGVAMPATVDPSGRVVAWPGRPSWAGVDLGAELGRLFPATPARWADDGDLAALAEATEAGHADLLYLGVGTGVGGGLVLGGRIHPGTEAGHLVIDRDGPRCDCGRRGCLQAVASGPATLRRAAAARGAPVTYPELASAWLAALPWAAAVVEEACEALAVAVVGIGELVHPSCVLIGGGFPAGLPGYVDAVADRVGRWARPGHRSAPITSAALGGLSSLHGAVQLAREIVIDGVPELASVGVSKHMREPSSELASEGSPQSASEGSSQSASGGGGGDSGC